MNKMLCCFTLFSLSVSRSEETLIVTHKTSGVCMKWLCVVIMVQCSASQPMGRGPLMGRKGLSGGPRNVLP